MSMLQTLSQSGVHNSQVGAYASIMPVMAEIYFDPPPEECEQMQS
jgi:hypothetical protein